MPIQTPNMGLIVPTVADVDGLLDEAKAKWSATRNRVALRRAMRRICALSAIAVKGAE